MKEDEQLPVKRRTFGEAALLLGFSFAPLAIAILVMGIKFLRRLLALPLFGLMIAASIWAGNRWYKFVRTDKGEVINEETGSMEEAPDWFAFAMAFLVGFGVLVFLRVLFTHEMARAYTDMIEPPSDDD